MYLTLLVHFRMHDLRCIIRTSGANYTSSMSARKAGVFIQMNILWDAIQRPIIHRLTFELGHSSVGGVPFN